MTAYVARREVIDARFWSGLSSLEECIEMAEWVGGYFDCEFGEFEKTYYWVIKIPNRVWLRPNQYIIKDEDGEIHVMDKKPFELRYIKLEDA